jgi:hypothetical protein
VGETQTIAEIESTFDTRNPLDISSLDEIGAEDRENTTDCTSSLETEYPADSLRRAEKSIAVDSFLPEEKTKRTDAGNLFDSGSDDIESYNKRECSKLTDSADSSDCKISFEAEYLMDWRNRAEASMESDCIG